MAEYPLTEPSPAGTETPVVLSVYHDGTRAVRLVAAAMASAEFRAATTEIAVPPHGVASTELADMLVCEHGLASARDTLRERSRAL